MAVAVPLRGETVLVVLWCVLCAGAVGVAAWRLGPLFGVPLALAAAVAIDSFYIAPYRTFDSRDWVNYLVTAMYIAIGVFVGAIIQATQSRAATSESARGRLDEEQAALRRVATLVARGARSEEVFAAVAVEMRNLVRADQTRIIRFEPDGTATLVGGTGADDRPGPLGPIEPGLATAEVLRTGRTTRVDDYGGISPDLVARWFGAPGSSPTSVGSPVIVAGALWGAIVAGSLEGPLPEETELRMADFTELLAIAIANASSRAELAASRARIVGAGDEARRRIERNLHDGVQQRLVSLALRLRMTETTAASRAARHQSCALRDRAGIERGHRGGPRDRAGRPSGDPHPGRPRPGAEKPRQGVRDTRRGRRGLRGTATRAGRGRGLLRCRRSASQRDQARSWSRARR